MERTEAAKTEGTAMIIAEHLQAIDADPDAWLNRGDVRGKVWEMLGKPCGTWQHDRCDRCGGDCVRCGASDNLTCPVPPPLDEPPEVVARKLIDSIDDIDAIVEAGSRLSGFSLTEKPGPIGTLKVLRWLLYASPHQQILACLVAGGKVGEE